MTVNEFPPTFHFPLNRLVGAWQGSTKSRLMPDDEWDEVATSATIRCVAANTFLLHEYDGQFAGEVASGVVLYGYNENKDVLTPPLGRRSSRVTIREFPYPMA